MVWFQCEDCGESLKKPKLPNHFNRCSASKLSCIDCGEVFGQATVERHTQCMTEAEKYGPKDQAKASNGMNAKPKNDSKQKPDVDINVGLSERPPWFCSLCNIKATSKQTLLLHADGKKHRAKARAFQAANQKPSATVETNTCDNGNDAENAPKPKDLEEPRDQNSFKVAIASNGSGVGNSALEPNKKRKVDASEEAAPPEEGNAKSESVNSKPVSINGAETHIAKPPKKAKHDATLEDVKLESTPDKDFGKKKINWKKLITSVLKSNPNGMLKFKELKRLVVKLLKESGHREDKNQVSEMLHQKINSSSRFVIDGKYVSLAS